MNLFHFLILGMIVLAVLETPLFLVLAGLSTICLFFVDFDTLSLQTILIEMNRLASMPVMVALPLFTCLGCLLTETGAPRRMMGFMDALVGWVPGGMGVAALCACAVFTALTGASGVTIVALGGLLYPILRQAGYGDKLTLGLLTTGGSLGLLFPPSLPVILYGVVSQSDIAGLYRAAFIPGVLILVALSLYTAIASRYGKRRNKRPKAASRVSWRGIFSTFLDGIWEWPIALLIGIGIYGGYATVVEVSAIVLAYAIVVHCFITKEVDFYRQLPGVMVESAVLSGAIVVILGFALGFTGYLVDEQVPQRLLATLVEWTDSRAVFLAALNLFLLAVGCVMDIFSAIVIVVPVIVPIALNYGIDPVHLGVIFLVNLEIGYSTPPVGMNLFIASLKFKKPVTLLYRASWPYLVILLCMLVLIAYLPLLSHFL